MNGLFGQIAIATGLALAVAVAGGIATIRSEWYLALRQPSWKPPDWAFGPVWTVIFAACVASAVIAWRAAPDASGRLVLLIAFGVNGGLNIAWSFLFFRFRRPDWAMAELIALWLSIVALILVSGQFSALSAWLLAPYLLWVTIAGRLNLAILQLNPHASRGLMPGQS